MFLSLCTFSSHMPRNPGHDSDLLSPEWLALDCGQQLKSPKAFCLPRRG